MSNAAAWGVNLPANTKNVIALDYGVRIVSIDESMANFIYAVKAMRDYAHATFGGWAPTGGASLCGLRESKEFCESIRRMAKQYTVLDITITMPVSADFSRERAVVALCGVLGTLGIAFHITSVTERLAQL